MIHRLVILLYGVTLAWALFWLWGMLQSGTQYLTPFYIFGLGPLILLMMTRVVLIGRL